MSYGNCIREQTLISTLFWVWVTDSLPDIFEWAYTTYMSGLECLGTSFRNSSSSRPNWLLLYNAMNAIQHNNTIQFLQKTHKFYKIVFCYCVVLRCWFFFCFFKLFRKQHNAIILFMPPFIVFLKPIQYHEHNTIQ